MLTTRRILLGGLAAASAFGLAALARPNRPVLAAPRGSGPVVLELFTSQGCSSCPPADELLGELAQAPDVIALAYHIDYWNYIGWEDPFSSKEMSDRQRRYAHAMKLRTIYTPQLVIDGEVDLVGSRRSVVLRELKRRRAQRGGLGLSVTLNRDGADFELLLKPEQGADHAGAELFLVGSDDRHVTEVPRGENRGRTLEDFAVVRFYRSLGRWDGKADTLRIPGSAASMRTDRLSVLVQAPGNGSIHGAAALDLRTA